MVDTSKDLKKSTLRVECALLPPTLPAAFRQSLLPASECKPSTIAIRGLGRLGVQAFQSTSLCQITPQSARIGSPSLTQMMPGCQIGAAVEPVACTTFPLS